MKKYKKYKKDKLTLSGYMLAIKYYLQGDDWAFAKEYAFTITNMIQKPK